MLRNTKVGGMGGELLEFWVAMENCKKSQGMMPKVYELSLKGLRSWSGPERKRKEKEVIPGQGARLHVQRLGGERGLML